MICKNKIFFLIKFIRWQKRYFQLKNGKLFWFKSKNNNQAKNSIDLKKIKKVNPIEDRKFEIILGKDEKVYEFFCDNNFKRDKWIKEINAEKKKIEKDIQKKYDTIFELEEKKKVIFDKYNFPLVENNQTYMKDYVDETITSDGNFLSKEEA